MMEKSRDDRIRVCMMMPKCHVGGAEVQVLSLLKNIDRSKFAVSLCLFNRGVASMEEEAAEYVEDIHYLGFKWRFFPVVFLKLVKYLQDGRFDILHAHLAWADLIGRFAAWFAGVPVRVTTEHGKGLWKSPLQVGIEKYMNQVTDMRICVSKDIYRIRKERESTPEDKLAYIPNGVDPDMFRIDDPGAGGRIREEFGWPADAPLVLSIGRIVEAKNYLMLVQAFEILRLRIPTARCLIAGDGRCRGDLLAAIEEAGLSGEMKLAGPRGDIVDLLGSADIFVLSSDREGLPVTLLEAMASGTPVVATGVGGIPEAVTDEQSALLVDPGDAHALAGAMERVLSDPDLSERLSAAAAAIVSDRFSIRSVTERVEEIYSAKYAEKKRR